MSVPNPFPLGTVTGTFTNAGRRMTIEAPFVFSDRDVLVKVPVGFVTDFNSVPRGLWNVFPPWEYPEAGVTHDWLYQHPGDRSRGAVDAIHRRIMELEGASRWLRTVAWLGIRAGGWEPWNDYRAAEEAKAA